jgi:hypothetical protein
MHGVVRRFAMATGAAALALGSAAGAVITTGTAAHAATAAPAAAAAPAYIPVPGTSTTNYASCGPTIGVCQDYYTVPAGVYGLHVVLVGGSGASGTDSNIQVAGVYGHGGAGGQGSQVVADLPVHPGENLNVNIGASGVSSGEFIVNEWLGGGPPGLETIHPQSSGGQGGGASAIDNCDDCGFVPFPNSILAIAGGGGGGGGGGSIMNGGSGGTGGSSSSNMNGGNGRGILFFGNGGGGGTATAGGSGGSGNGNDSGTAGGALNGGVGAVRTGITPPSKLIFFDGGGGGGGGWFGGGGGGEGANGGGGGGGAGSSAVLQGGTVESIAPTSKSPMVSITPAVVPPAAPTGVSAVVGLQQATVSFGPPPNNGGSPVQRYTVYATASDPGFDQTASGTGSPITVRNLTPGQTYTFTVTATNRAGEGPPSAPSNSVVPYRVPGAPTITSTTAGNGQATVAFTPSAADKRLGNPITSYTVTVRPGVNVTSGPVFTTASGATSPITVTGLTNGQNYTVTVHATNAAGSGPESAPKVVFPQTVPGAPTNVTAANATPVGATTGTVNLTFTPPADNGGRPVLNYTAVSSPGGITATAGAGSGGITVTGLTIGTSYTFTVYATNADGNGPASDPSNAVTPTGVGMPSPPQTPGAATLDQAAYVSCLPPASDGGSDITSYTVTSSPGGITATGSSCPILVTGLTDGTSYTFTVTATNADGGTSEPSQATSAITPHAPSGPAPSNDNFANAKVITGTSGSVAGTNVGATVEPGEQTIQDTRGGASVWYEWTVPVTGSYQFDTCTANPGVYGLIGLFEGDSVSNATEFGPGPGQDLCPAGEAGSTIITGTMSAGLTLYIKFDGFNENGSNANPPYEGPFSLEWALQS